MRFIILVFFIFIAEFSAYSSDEIIGKKLIIHSKIIGEDRPVSIFIPAGVKNTNPFMLYTYLIANIIFILSRVSCNL